MRNDFWREKSVYCVVAIIAWTKPLTQILKKYAVKLTKSLKETNVFLVTFFPLLFRHRGVTMQTETDLGSALGGMRGIRRAAQ